MSMQEVIEASVLHQAAGITDGLVVQRPVRLVDPGVTRQALIGGGSSRPCPGEVSLAHRGVLFVDEMLAFSRALLDSLRGPLQDGYVPLNRVEFRHVFPSRFQLIAATNPCPCGYAGSPKPCVCSKRARTEYVKRLSGALLDRIAIRVKLDCLGSAAMSEHRAGITTLSASQTIEEARRMQERRYAGSGVTCNDEVSAESKDLLEVHESGFAVLGCAPWMSPREAEAALKVARTLADMRGAWFVEADDVQAAIALACEARTLFE